MGLGLGMTFLPSLSIVSHHFRRRRALAIGIVSSGSSVGGIVFPIMLNRLFQSPHVGFANGVRASGAVVGSLLLLGNCLMRTRLPSKRQTGMAHLAWRDVRNIIWDGAYLWSIVGCVKFAVGKSCEWLTIGIAGRSLPAWAYMYRVR